MKRRRHRGDTKVWHDPLVASPGKHRSPTAGPADDGEAAQPRRRRAEPVKRAGARIIAGPPQITDPRELERERLLDRVLAAEGRPAITGAARRYVEAGFEFPPDQRVWLQLLEHKEEEQVLLAIEQLTAILEEQEPLRRAVLESRLRRIEEFADEDCTQAAAAHLRRILSAKHNGAPSSR